MAQHACPRRIEACKIGKRIWIVAAVVDHDHIHLGVISGSHTIEAGAQQIDPISGRHDDRHQRQISTNHGRRRHCRHRRPRRAVVQHAADMVHTAALNCRRDQMVRPIGVLGRCLQIAARATYDSGTGQIIVVLKKLAVPVRLEMRFDPPIPAIEQIVVSIQQMNRGIGHGGAVGRSRPGCQPITSLYRQQPRLGLPIDGCCRSGNIAGMIGADHECRNMFVGQVLQCVRQCRVCRCRGRNQRNDRGQLAARTISFVGMLITQTPQLISLG